MKNTPPEEIQKQWWNELKAKSSTEYEACQQWTSYLLERTVEWATSADSYETRLRDEFAIAALPAVYREAMAGARQGSGLFQDEHWRMGLALCAYKMADAMLAARKKGGE